MTHHPVHVGQTDQINACAVHAVLGHKPMQPVRQLHNTYVTV